MPTIECFTKPRLVRAVCRNHGNRPWFIRARADSSESVHYAPVGASLTVVHGQRNGKLIGVTDGRDLPLHAHAAVRLRTTLPPTARRHRYGDGQTDAARTWLT